MTPEDPRIGEIEARYAVPDGLRFSPEGDMLRPQKELALYLLDVQPPQSPEDQGTPKYRALKAYTELSEKDLELRETPDFRSFGYRAEKYESAAAKQLAEERKSLDVAMRTEWNTNREFRLAEDTFYIIGSLIYKAKSRSRMFIGLEEYNKDLVVRKTTNEIFRNALNGIDNYPNQQTQIPLRKNIPAKIRPSTLHVVK